MASAFTHSFVAYTFSKLMKGQYLTLSVLIWGIICSAIPDADVMMFKLGYSYSHPLGHRGFFHSFFFCAILAFAISICYKLFTQRNSKTVFLIFIYLSLCACSHGLLDAMTTGGKGIAFFAPFDNTRYFFPFRPIKVSPLGIERFFSEWGVQVLLSEFKWVISSCLLLLLINSLFRRK